MLQDHRRAILWSAGLLGAMALVFVAVGRHPPELAPLTTLPIVGEWDAAVYRAVDGLRTDVLTWLARALNVLGSGVVTIPLRIAVAVWLLVRRRWRWLAVWLITWVSAELVLRAAKEFFHRGRPPGSLVGPGSLVETIGFSFPSGHAVAAAATAVALVLVLLPPGASRRKWEMAAIGFAFLMALSRVYLYAHWLSDVVAGILLGVGVALGAGGLVTEARHVLARRQDRARARSA